MANQIFMRVNEVAEELGISVPYAYKLIRQMNEELAKTGCITISGRIDRKFFHEKFYGTSRSETERGRNNYGGVQEQGQRHLVCSVPLHRLEG
ncbi:DNA-binding protein [Dysosmobacter welbionis]|uniref:DNA-binding protein n=1 Tax=Dysosmobacter welbionis TaxID=2093857 RepID=UPI00403A44BA